MAVPNNTANPKERIDRPSPEVLSTKTGPERKIQPTIERPDTLAESVRPQAEKAPWEKPSVKKVSAKRFQQKQPQAISAQADPKISAIKNVLGKDLGPIYYNNMDKKLQHEFLVEEEKTAVKIKEELAEDPVKPKKIFKTIFSWLKMIPLVNKFFLKQEAKIKTDQVVNLEKRQ